MNIDFFGALRYPYQKKNRLNAWLLPSLVGIVSSSFVAALNSDILLWVFAILGNILILGYLWKMSEDFSKSGMEVPCAKWSLGLARNGLKVYVYFIAVYLLVMALLVQPFDSYFVEGEKYYLLAWVVAICVSVYLLPVLAAPVIYSSPMHSFKALINFPAAFQFMSTRYGQCNQAMLFVYFLLTVYVAVFVIIINLLVSFGGYQFLYLLVPFGVFPLLMSAWHLINQGFFNPIEE